MDEQSVPQPHIDDLIVLNFPRKTMTCEEIIEQFKKQGSIVKEIPWQPYREAILARVEENFKENDATMEIANPEECSVFIQKKLPNGKIFIDERVIRVFQFVSNVLPQAQKP